MKAPKLPKGNINTDPLKDLPYNPELMGNDYGTAEPDYEQSVALEAPFLDTAIPPEKTFQQPSWWESLFMNKKPSLSGELVDLLRMQEEVNTLAKQFPEAAAQEEFNRLNKKEK